MAQISLIRDKIGDRDPGLLPGSINYPRPVLDPHYAKYYQSGQVMDIAKEERAKYDTHGFAAFGRHQPTGLPIHGPLPYEQCFLTNIPHDLDLSGNWITARPLLAQLGIQVQRKIMGGSFGEVWRVRMGPGNNYMAMKILQIKQFIGKYGSLTEAMRMMLRDVESVRGLRHPNMVSVENVLHVRDDRTGFRAVYSFIFMELCDGDMLDEMDKLPGDVYDEVGAHRWFKQIIEGLDYLHQNRVAHLDIKPDNILFKLQPRRAPNVYKLADFGLAEVFHADEPSMERSIKKGTPRYLPPEVFVYKLLPPNSPVQVFDMEKCDIYSLGMTLALSLIGFNGIDQYCIPTTGWVQGLDPNSFIDDFLVFTNKYLRNHPMIDLLMSMTNTVPGQRPTIQQLRNNPWLQQVL
ncbi:serine/threonine-protein kinase STK11-like [Oppia nitens]|uniref:serine/threonine-protein kinase STK11-like n=1 Tax=Oppia nitens TaxID=1686743 RepID=UPI0023DAD09F|nr:serine/threonine-protein kinase STK11-like [Oppia nitens]